MEFRVQDQENSSHYFPPSAAATKDSYPGLPTAATTMVSSLEERRDRLNHHHLIHQLDGVDLIPDPAPTGSGLVSRSPPPPAASTTPTTTTAVAAAEEAATSKSKVTYRECLKNHAANMGGHVVDGCGEFMPSGQDGTQESMKCAACECHRNFHRKESEGERQQQKYLLPSNSFNTTHHLYKNNNTLPHPPLPLPPPPPHPPTHHHNNQHHTHGFRGSMIMNFGGSGGGAGAGEESSSEDLNGYESNNNFIQGQAGVLPQPSSMRKRFRTKFSPEQKEKMMEFADKIDWKMQKQDNQQVLQFCSQLGIKRKVFKVWMHNNKQASKKKPM